MNFKMTNMTTFIKLIAILFFPIQGLVLGANEIEFRDTNIIWSYVNNSGKIYKKYREDFTSKTGVHSSIKKWSSFKDALDSNKKKGVAGEVAAKIFFESKVYKILEEHYENHITILSNADEQNEDMKTDGTCTTKKGPDNGIDGIFFLATEDFGYPTHIAINEAKYRDRLYLAEDDFGFVADKIQQSHSKWNSSRFNSVTCLPPGLRYDSQVAIRLATLLDENGTLHLYEVRDKDKRRSIVGEYASEAPATWNIKKACGMLM